MAQGYLEPNVYEVGWDYDDDIVAVEEVSDGAVVVHEVDPGATGGVCERRRPQHPCSERRSQLELLLVSGWRRFAVCKCFEP